MWIWGHLSRRPGKKKEKEGGRERWKEEEGEGFFSCEFLNRPVVRFFFVCLISIWLLKQLKCSLH